MTELHLMVAPYQGDMYHPGTGRSAFAMMVVRQLVIPDVESLILDSRGFDGDSVRPYQLELPDVMARRIGVFARRYLSSSLICPDNDFDCRAFVHYVAGWDDHIRTGTPMVYRGRYVDADHSEPGSAYVVATSDGTPVQHAMLGTGAPGYSLGVIGKGYPLVIAKNSDLVRAFGGSGTMLVESAVRLA